MVEFSYVVNEENSWFSFIDVIYATALRLVRNDFHTTLPFKEPLDRVRATSETGLLACSLKGIMGSDDTQAGLSPSHPHALSTGDRYNGRKVNILQVLLVKPKVNKAVLC